jgi:DNA-binding transcriptional ArsR family regulator
VAASRTQLLDDDTYVELAELFRALGDATRAKMVFSLLQQDLCTCDLAELTGISESAVSQHLRVLRSLRLVKSRRAGKQVFHSLDDAHIAILLHVGLSHVRDGDADHPTMEQLLTHLVPLEGGHR